MRQLIQEGWIHHVCRNSLAIFLTRGDLFISWEKGMIVFFKYLIDVKKLILLKQDHITLINLFQIG